MKILDCTSSVRGIWFKKNHPDVIYTDLRPEVNPNILADVRHLPFKDHVFDLVVFDPPHGVIGANGQMAEIYGHWNTAHILNSTLGGLIEIARVLKPEGLCAFKWSDHDIKVSRILSDATPLEPLFGQVVSYRTKHSAQTEWILLRPKVKLGV